MTSPYWSLPQLRGLLLHQAPLQLAKPECQNTTAVIQCHIQGHLSIVMQEAVPKLFLSVADATLMMSQESDIVTRLLDPCAKGSAKVQ